MTKNSVTVRVPSDIVQWARETFTPMMNVGFIPSDSQIVVHALVQLKSNWCNEDIKMEIRKDRVIYKR